MATTTNDTTPLPPPSASAESYIGSLLSVTSKSEIRYEGILYYLNPHDSTLALQNVRSYGTEGRKKDGPQVPPTDKVYEYILFRGKDIKDLEVKTSLPAKIEEPIHIDPAIIRATELPSSSIKSAAASNGSLTEFNFNSGASAVNAMSYPSLLPSHFSGSQMGIWDSSTTSQSAVSSNDFPTLWQGYSGVPGTISSPQQQSLLPNSTLYNIQNPHSSTMNNVSPAHLLATSSSIYLGTAPSLTSEQHSKPSPDALSSSLSPQFRHSTLINSNGLTMPFPLTYSSTSSVEAPVVNKVIFDSLSSPAQSSPYPTSLVSDIVSEPLLKKTPPLLTPNQISQHRLSEFSSSQNDVGDQKNFYDMKAISPNFSSSSATVAVQPPLLPLPPASQKLKNNQFTEEFDFQAMNEKFKKLEAWEYLGKAKNQRGETEGVDEKEKSNQDSGDDNADSVTHGETKCAYNKDDFFDSISCNSIGRGARNGQDRTSERMKPNSETFGTFRHRTQPSYNGYGSRTQPNHGGYGQRPQPSYNGYGQRPQPSYSGYGQRPQPSYSGYGAGRGQHHGTYHRGRGYGYGNRGRGGYTRDPNI